MDLSKPSAPARRWRAWIEASAFFAGAVALDSMLGLLGLPVGSALPVYVAAPLIVALRNGFVPALATALLCVALDLARLPDGRALVQIVAGWSCIVGVSTVGLFVERLSRQIAHLGHVVAALRGALDGAPTPPPSLPASAGRPARARTDSLPRLLYRYARLLNVTDESALYAGLAITLAEALPADAVAIFALTPTGPVHAAGDALRSPDPAALDFGSGRRVVEVEPGGRAVARVHAGSDGPPVALIVVVGAGQVARRAEALRLLEAFADWGSAVVGHARTLRTLSSERRVENAQQAEARGREAARQFARTGRLTLVPGGPRDTLRERVDLSFDFEESAITPAGSPAVSGDETERLDGAVADELLDSGWLEEVSGDSERRGDDTDGPSLIIGATRASMQLEALGERRERRRSDRLPPVDGAALNGATLIDSAPPEADDRPTQPTRPDPPVEASRPPLTPARPSAAPPMREAEAITPEVRRAIERMARRLAAPSPGFAPGFAPGDDPLGGVDAAAIEHYEMPGVEGETIAAHELPLIGGAAFGVGVAQEVGRSVADRRFATLLAQLGDHLEAE